MKVMQLKMGSLLWVRTLWLLLCLGKGTTCLLYTSVILERNILPGYILVEAVSSKFTPEMVQTISNVTNVIHFLGKNSPIPMSQTEANRMLGKVDESQEVSASMIEPFIVGETIKIIDGPFNDFIGCLLYTSRCV